MLYMNDYDLTFAVRRFTHAAKPNRLALALVVRNLAEWANENSDGWAYWPKPAKAAEKAMRIIQSTTNEANAEQEAHDIDAEELEGAVRPIKAFLTRQHVSADDRVRILGCLR